MMKRICKLVCMGCVLVVRVFGCVVNFRRFSPNEGVCLGCMMNRNRQMRGVCKIHDEQESLNKKAV